MPEQNGGQFFYAKAFDKFAPIGPVLVNSAIYRNGDGARLTTRVNGEVMQSVEIKKDVIFSPSQILSFISQSKSILFPLCNNDHKWFTDLSSQARPSRRIRR
jgi:2-keto-4-pentenoate hydratase/2-oxohepta-3-ene-1,7-dioic acid hydratase in catechol pathway